MTSKFRKLASQLCATFPYSCLNIAFGTLTGYVVVLVAELHKKDSEIPTTMDQLSWFASVEIMKPICTLVTGLLMHRWGCRPLAFTAALLYIAAGLMYYLSTTVMIIFVGRLLSSLFSVTTITNPYISEISEPQLRSRLFMVAHLCNAIGVFFSILLSSLMYWRTIALVILVFPVLAAVTVLATPHSPIWLASKGRIDEADKSLRWVRGWVNSKQVQAELDTLVTSTQKSKSISTEQTYVTGSVTWQERSTVFFKLFIQRSFYVPLNAMCLIFLLYSLSGVTTIDTYAIVIFRQLDSPIEESRTTAIMRAMVVIGCLVLMLFVHRVGKRNLIFFSVAVTGLCYAAVATNGLLELKGLHLWVPPIAVITAKFANTMGITSFVTMLPSEIFPSSVRYIGSSISVSVKIVVESLMKKLFLYAVKAYTLPAVFAFFALMNLLGLITYYFLVPETEGKSLKEIENHYTAVRSKPKREISNKN